MSIKLGYNIQEKLFNYIYYTVVQIVMDQSELTISEYPLKTNATSSIYEIHRQSETFFGKIFESKALKNDMFMDALDFNLEVLKEEKDKLIYSEYMLPILNEYQTQKGRMFMIPVYNCRLDQYIKSRAYLKQSQILCIAQDILKAIYGINVAGFYHKNLRPQHFVLHEGNWKLQSLIADEYSFKQLPINQYMYSTEYCPPQAYSNEKFTDKQIEERIVWNIGCIIIYMIQSQNKLNNLSNLNKFKNEPFSFDKIGSQKGKKCSIQLKQMLGKMCHYNYQKRITFKHLVQSGFFSKQVAHHYQHIYVSPIDKETHNYIKNELEKGKILTTGDQKLLKVTSLKNNQKQSQHLFELTTYALNFVKSMDLCKMQKTLKQKYKLFPLFFESSSDQQNEKQLKLDTYTIMGLAKMIKSTRKKSVKELSIIRKMINFQKLDNEINIQNFVKKMNPQECFFGDIKKPYKQIIKKSYVLNTDDYNLNKTREGAEIGMYLTYCLLIDAIYNSKDFKDNFKHYFELMNQKETEYVTAEGFHEYLQKAEQNQLVKHAKDIISKYYPIKK